MFAGNHHLDNLVLIVDHNGLQIDGTIEEVNSAMPITNKFEAFGFHVIELADGNDMAQVRAAFEAARSVTGKPVCIVAETVKGKGVSYMENQVGWHGKAPDDDQLEQAMAKFGPRGRAHKGGVRDGRHEDRHPRELRRDVGRAGRRAR